jgi:hypothetical protein
MRRARRVGDYPAGHLLYNGERAARAVSWVLMVLRFGPVRCGVVLYVRSPVFCTERKEKRREELWEGREVGTRRGAHRPTPPHPH